MNERLRNGLVNTGLVVLSVVVFFVILEAYFVVFNPQIFDNPSFIQYDETLGWTNKPNAEGIVETQEFNPHAKINTKGLRDREYDYKKPEGIKRIVVLGDSFTWGAGIEDKERYTEILEDSLLKNIQVINMGVSAYGTDREFLTLKEEGVRYNPDLVVVAFCVGNDIIDNTHPVYSYFKPIFILNDENISLTNVSVPYINIKKEEIIIKNTDNVTPILSFKGLIGQQSHTYAFIAKRIASNPNLLNLCKKIGIVDKKAPLRGEQALKRQHELDPYGWNLTKAILREINTVAKANNTKTFIVLIPSREQVNRHLDSDINEALFNFGKENDISVLDLLPEFRKHANIGEQLYYPLDGHWNPNGHRLAAELIYDTLIEEELITIGGEE